MNDNRHAKTWAAFLWTFLAMAVLILFCSFVWTDRRAARGFIMQPPAQYTGVPTNYEERHVNLMTIRFVCRNMRAIACAMMPTVNRAKCIVLLPPEHWLMEELRSHEHGHCNGWPAGHPNGRRPFGSW